MDALLVKYLANRETDVIEGLEKKKEKQSTAGIVIKSISWLVQVIIWILALYLQLKCDGLNIKTLFACCCPSCYLIYYAAIGKKDCLDSY